MAMKNKKSFERPKIDYHDVKHAWFDYADSRYQVASVPTRVFRAAVLEKVPVWKQHPDYGPLLHKRELDLVDKWYLLCALADVKRGIVLYSSAEQVVG